MTFAIRFGLPTGPRQQSREANVEGWKVEWSRKQERTYQLRQLQARRASARLLGYHPSLGDPPDWVLTMTRAEVKALMLCLELQAI